MARARACWIFCAAPPRDTVSICFKAKSFPCSSMSQQADNFSSTMFQQQKSRIFTPTGSRPWGASRHEPLIWVDRHNSCSPQIVPASPVIWKTLQTFEAARLTSTSLVSCRPSLESTPKRGGTWTILSRVTGFKGFIHHELMKRYYSITSFAFRTVIAASS